MKKKSLVFFASILALAGLAGCNQEDVGGLAADDLAVASVTLDVTYQKLEVGESLLLTPTINYKDGVDAEKVNCYKEWKTSNNKVATVSDEGMVLALKTGRAAITYIAGYKSASCSIEVPGNDIYVNPGDDPSGEGEQQPGEFTIRLNASSITLSTGSTYQLRATTSSEASVSWTSTDEAIASVSQAGLVTANKEGNATIHATSNGKSVSCEVTVADTEEDLPHDEDMTIQIYFFVDYNNVDEEDTTGKKLLSHFWWYPDQPIAQSGKVPANPTQAPTSDFPYFAGWSTHPIIDTKDYLLDLTTCKAEDETDNLFLFIYGIWTDVQGGMTK